MIPTTVVEHGGVDYTVAVSLGHTSEIERGCGGHKADGAIAPKAISDINTALIKGIYGEEGGYSQKEATIPFRIGLVAAGMAEGAAKELIDRIYYAEGLDRLAKLSLAVVQVAIDGVPRDQKNDEDDKKKDQLPSTEAQSSPQSSEPEATLPASTE